MNNRKAVITIGLMPVLALTTSSVFAQGVAISGSLDIGVFRGFDKSNNVGTIQRSNIAFTGSEDLGDGMSATFALSHRLEVDTGKGEGAGSKPFWQGESTVGLKSGWGHVRLGRALDVVSANDWSYDPWYNFDRIASPAWNNWHWNYASDRTSNTGSAEYGRLTNGVFYDSPNFNGITVHLSGSFENDSTTAGAGTGNNGGVSLNYDKGPVSMMLASSKNRSGDTVLFAGAKYTIGAFDVMGAYDKSVYKAATDSTAKVYTLGAVYRIGAASLKAGYGHRDVDGAKTKFIGLGANYALSKRTSVYVSLGNNRPDGADNATAYGVGVTHSF